MPPSAVSYVPQPYVRGTTAGELLRLRGRNAAEAELRRGDITQQMFARLGEQIGNSINSYAKERQEAPIRAQQQEMADLQLKNARAESAQRDTLSKQDQAFATFLAANHNTDTGEFMLPDPRGAIAILGPERGLKAFEGIKAYHELQTGAVKDARDTAGRLALGLKTMSPALQAQLWPGVRTAAIKGGLGDEQAIPEQVTPEFLDGVIAWSSGKTPDADPLIQRDPTRDLVNGRTGAVVTPGTPAAKEPKKYPVTVTGPDGRPVEKLVTEDELAKGVPVWREPKSTSDQPLIAIAGPDGKPVLVPRSQAVGKTPASGTQRATSGVEKQTLSFFNRARQADIDLEALEPEVQKLGIVGQERMAHAPNWAQTDLGQQYTQAQRAFTEARLRKDSGAAIPEQEFENDRRTYFVQPGDSVETQEQKRRARATILSSLGFGAGQALGEFVGDPDEARSIVNGYKTRAEKAQIVVTAPDGSQHPFATQAEADRFKQLAGIK